MSAPQLLIIPPTPLYPADFIQCLSQGVQHLSPLLIIVLGDLSTLIQVSQFPIINLLVSSSHFLLTSQGSYGFWGSAKEKASELSNPQEKKDHSASEHCFLF